MTLLEDAKKTGVRRKFIQSNFSHEQIELAIGWVKDEVTLGQVNNAQVFRGNSAYIFLAYALKQYLKSL